MNAANSPEAGLDLAQRTLWRVAAVCVGWYLVILVAPRIHPLPDIRAVALDIHVLSLALGFGAVLAVDAAGLAVLLGRVRLTSLLRFSAHADWLIWTGFLGLVLSGTALEPNLGDPWADVNLIATLVAAVNGVLAGALRSTLPALSAGSRWQDLSGSQLRRAGCAAAVSQLAWWTSILIGTLTS